MDSVLNHSIENIYTQVGQFDRYAVFDFYYGSEAERTYGRNVHGLIIYTPSERAILDESTMAGNNYSNNDGIVRVDGSLKDEALNLKLRIEGFRASDICSLSAVDSGPITKKYNTSGTKEIPNTITVNVHSKHGNPYQQILLNYELRVSDGLPLLPNEARQYVCLRFLTNPCDTTRDEMNELCTNKDTGVFDNDATITLYSYYYNEFDKDNAAVKTILNQALKERRLERTNFVLRHLGISQKHLDEVKGTSKDSWNEMMKVVLGFDSHVIAVWDWFYPVWWDFERFIHIYLRHYENFSIKGSSKGQGTVFQYHNKDIRRLIGIVIANNKADIEACLSIGRPFSKYGEQGYYYNGNYYTFKIEKDGRLMQFHPQE